MRDVTSETARFQPVGETFVCTKVQRHDPAVTVEMFPSAKSTIPKKREQTNRAVPFPLSLVLNAPAQLSLAPNYCQTRNIYLFKTLNICGSRPANLCSGGISSATKGTVKVPLFFFS